MSTNKKLWALTSYYNPMKYESRLNNYKIFSRNIGVPLVTVELSFGGQLQLTESDADILIQIEEGDIMFQKERLLNIALSQVPADVSCVAWVDCDLCLSNGWGDKAIAALEDYPLIQLFSRFYDLPKNSLPDDIDTLSLPANVPVGKFLASGASAYDACNIPSSGRYTGGHLFGIAWAGRAEVLRACNFYDACIVGSGDRASAYAAMGQFEAAKKHMEMNEKRWDHYREWAEILHRQVRGRLGFIDSNVYHLWHGDLADRNYIDRHTGFRIFDFDPNEDIALTASGSWRWNSDKPEMHAYLRRYFQLRNEDGKNPNKRVNIY